MQYSLSSSAIHWDPLNLLTGDTYQQFWYNGVELIAKLVPLFTVSVNPKTIVELSHQVSIEINNESEGKCM